MAEEFITTRGKAIVERNILYIRNFNLDFMNSLIGKLFFPMVLSLAITLELIYAKNTFDYFKAIIWCILFSNYYYTLFDALFRRSFANRIPLDRIKSFELLEDNSGLEIELILHLKNGRYRPIAFRKLEKQYEPLTELLSQSVGQPQFA